MKTALAAAVFTLAALSTAAAQPADAPPQPDPQPEPSCPDCPQPAAPPPSHVAYAEPAPGPAPLGVNTQPPSDFVVDDDGTWKRPPGRRFLHGFRLGWTYVFNMRSDTRDTDGDGVGDMSLENEFDLKSPNMMLLGYEGFYRIVGHSWLNVLIVGNVTVAGLEQSKFIPAASGLLGFEFNRNFQLGVGVNITPDPEAPTHMIAAAGWTPRVGSIHTPVHFFFVPDADRNHRMGATVGMSW